MRIDKINNQSFGNKKFRLPINHIIYTIDGLPLWSRKSYAVREYSNPNAKELYKKAKQATDLKEMTRLYDEMGHYEIKKMNFPERVKHFFHI